MTKAFAILRHKILYKHDTRHEFVIIDFMFYFFFFFLLCFVWVHVKIEKPHGLMRYRTLDRLYNVQRTAILHNKNVNYFDLFVNTSKQRSNSISMNGNSVVVIVAALRTGILYFVSRSKLWCYICMYTTQNNVISTVYSMFT